MFRKDADDCVLMCSGRMQMTVFSCVQGDADDCVLMCSERMQMTVCSCVQVGCR